MIISGIQKNSFVDFPGKLSAVVFTPGCNMNCFYCHNRMLISGGNSEELVDEDSFWICFRIERAFGRRGCEWWRAYPPKDLGIS